METYKLYAVKTWGSAIAELTFKVSGVPYELEWLTSEQVHSAEYRRINPLEQIPSLRLPDGQIMTESLAICLYIDSIGKKGLVPPPGSSDYPRFLRWSVFLSTIYSVASYFDHPDWYVNDNGAQEELKAATLKKVKERFLLMEREAREPHFLGEQLSLIDIYLAVMTFWEPRREWFEKECPRLMKVVDRFQTTQEFKDVFAHNTP